MSISSPAKLERIERHLMRQRGAGVRTVSANFGFCFGTSAPTSSDPTPESAKPTGKRRKTRLGNNILAVEKDLPSVATENTAGKNTKPIKPRKRWTAVEEEEKTSRVAAVDDSDSFILGLVAKRTAAKGSKKNKSDEKEGEHRDIAVTEQTVPSKRGRHAVTAGGEGANGCAQDTVDPQTRGPKFKKEVKGTRRTQAQAVVKSHEESLVDRNNGPSDEGCPGKRPRGRPRTKKCESEPVKELVQPEVNGVGTPEGDRQAQPAKPVQPASRKRRKLEMAVDCEVPYKVQSSTQQHLSGLAEAKKEFADIAPSIQCNDVAMRTSQQTYTGSNARRGVLKEADSNATMRSISPEKAKNGNETASADDYMESRKPKRLVPAKIATAGRSKRGKVQVQHDSETLDAKIEDDTNPRNKTVADELHNESGDDRPPKPIILDHSKPEDVVSPSLPSSTRPRATTAKEKMRKAEHTELSRHKTATPEELVTTDEDVDWIFEAQPVRQRPKDPQKYPAPRTAISKTRSKMPDIDLDDLLSNIASFAKTDALTKFGAGVKPPQAVKTLDKRKQKVV